MGSTWPDPDLYQPRALALLTLQNPLRRMCIAAVEWVWFDRFVLGVILLNSLQLAMFDPFDIPSLQPNEDSLLSGKTWPPVSRVFLERAGLAFSALFLGECIVRVIARGFIRSPQSYLRYTWWNVLDFVIVVMGVLDFFPGATSGGGAISSFRLFRVLRVLRTVTTFHELKMLVLVLLRSLPLLADVLVLCCCIFFVFGILGVQIFKGSLMGRCYSIEDGAMVSEDICAPGVLIGETEADAISSALISKGMQLDWGGMHRCQLGRSECLPLGENPGRGSIHFDNTISAVLAIFQIMTLEGWADLMYQTQDAVGVSSFLYFMALIAIGPYFAVQLFLVILSTNCADAAQGKVVNRVTKKELASRVGTVAINRSKPPPPEGLAKLRKQLRVFATGDTLLNLTLAIICLNTLCMALEGVCVFEDGEIDAGVQCARLKGSLEVLNILFTVLFLFEFMIKIVGLGLMDYYFVGWGTPETTLNMANILDFIIVVASLIELPKVLGTMTCYLEGLAPEWEHSYVRLPTDVSDAILSNHTQQLLTVPRAIVSEDGVLQVNPLQYYACESGGGFFTVLRAFRLVRLVKFMRALPELQSQVKILVEILGSVMALLGLIAILLIIFAVLGMQTLGGVLVAEWDVSMVRHGASVFANVPVFNGTAYTMARRQGTVTQRRTDPSTGLDMWLFQDGWGSGLNAAHVNASLGGSLSGEGTLWVAAFEDVEEALASERMPVIVGVPPRLNFDNLGNALLTAFQVITIANWNDNMYDAWAAAGSDGILSALYYWALVILGNWMLFNLFVAILIQKFMQKKKQADAYNVDKMQKRILSQLGHLDDAALAKACDLVYAVMDSNSSGGIDYNEFQQGMLQCWGVKFSNKIFHTHFNKYDTDGSGMISADEFLNLIKELLALARESKLGGWGADEAGNKDKELPGDVGEKTDETVTLASGANGAERSLNLQMKADVNKELGHSQALKRQMVNQSSALAVTSRLLDPQGDGAEVVLGCLRADNVLRRACIYLVHENSVVGIAFQNFILLCIIVSTLALSMDNPLIGTTSFLRTFLDTIDLTVNIAFTLEFVIKLVALGWKHYISSNWNRLNLVIVVAADLEMLLSVLLPNSSASILRVFRLLRLLRPLRMAAEHFPAPILKSPLCMPLCSRFARALTFQNVHCRAYWS